MQGRFERTDVAAAREDLKNRTLAKIGPEFGRLIYLASTRDYNTGRYYHDGLAFQFSEEVAEKVIAEAHREVFMNLTLGALEDFANELQLYFSSVAVEPREIVRAWEKLEPYRIAVPVDCDPLTVSLFSANVKLALAIVESRQRAAQ
ncbi:MAG TPA: hypothetical protein VNB49_13150 [Candidatus Dormibacteraeota bacterium]|nr:hypothetical protein [Candidatus Dormibacteraeota bacterium]